MCACAIRSWGFTALFSSVLTGNDVTRSRVPSGARMRNRKLRFPALFSGVFLFSIFFFFFFLFLFFFLFFHFCSFFFSFFYFFFFWIQENEKFLYRHTSNVGFQMLQFEKIREKRCSFFIDMCDIFIMCFVLFLFFVFWVEFQRYCRCCCCCCGGGGGGRWRRLLLLLEEEGGRRRFLWV